MRGSDIPASISRGSAIMSADHISVYTAKKHHFRDELKNNSHARWISFAITLTCAGARYKDCCAPLPLFTTLSVRPHERFLLI